MPITYKQLVLAPRVILRHVVAVLLWSNAVFATHFIQLPELRIRVSTSVILDIALLSFIFFYGVVSNYGWMSVWFDVLYIYLWPFILLFKGLFACGKYAWRQFKEKPKASMASVNEVSIAKPETKTPAKDIKPTPVVLRVFGQFALLWSILILNTQSNVIAAVAVVAALFGALRATYNLWDLISDSIDWVESLESPFSQHLGEAIRTIRQSDAVKDTKEIKQAANLLNLAEIACSFLTEKKRLLSKLTKIIALCVTIPLYIYISSIFAAVYMGIAKIEHLTLDWRSALIDSLFVPIAFTDLPHSFMIRLVAGLQALVIGAMGYNVLFRHFTTKINGLSSAAQELARPLQDRELKGLVVLHADKLAFIQKPEISETTSKDGIVV